MTATVRLIRSLRRWPWAHRTTAVVFLGVAVWIVFVGNGIVAMTIYSFTPGQRATVPESWPGGSILAHDHGQPTLLFFAHPRCPCTSASLQELKLVLSQVETPIRCQAVFLVPPEADANWKNSSLIQTARNIPGVSVVLDTGEETRRFEIKTSGHVLLYDANDHLAFSGGITFSRGHRGTNTGELALVQLLNQKSAKDRQSPTFGCPLFDESSICRESSLCPK